MDLDKIKTLIDTMAASDLTELEFKENGWTLRLARMPKQFSSSGPRARASFAPAKQFVEVATARSSSTPSVAPVIAAPLSGVVYLCPGPEKPPFVSVGQPVDAGAAVCLIEAMKVFIEIHAEAAGIVEAVLVASGEEVEAGQPLFRLAWPTA